MGKTLAVTAAAVAHAPGTWRLIYFDAPHRGEQMRMLFSLASTAFTDVRCEYPRGLDPYKKAAMGEASPLLGTDLCPAVTAPDGTHCVESSDIMRFIGQRVGMAPAAGSAEDEKAMAVTLVAQEVLNQVFYALLLQMIVRRLLATELFGVLSWAKRLVLGREASYVAKPRAALDKHLAAIEEALVESGGPYVCGSQLTYADASVYAILNEALAFEVFDKPALLAAHPRLAAHTADLGGRLAPWVEQRVREHQCGISATVAYLVATNTPFPWSRVRKG